MPRAKPCSLPLYCFLTKYDYQQNFTNPDKFDEQIAAWNQEIAGKQLKPFLAIEMCVNAPAYQSGSYKIAFLMGELYHKDLTMMNAAALGYCWNLLNTVQPSFEASRNLFAVDEKRAIFPYPLPINCGLWVHLADICQRGFNALKRCLTKRIYW